MNSTHLVLRAFSAAGRLLQPGTLVDASAWPNVRLLVEQGYLAEAPPTPVPRVEAKPIKPKV